VSGGLLLYLAAVGAVAAERLLELAIARGNLRSASARGGFVADRRTYWDVAVMQVAWLAACAAEPLLLPRPFIAPLAIPMLVLLVACQALRYWAVLTLGDRWNLRIVVVPGEPVVTDGPYRFVRHPNYLAVLVEFVALPLVHTAWLSAVVFAALGALVTFRRIRLEEAALAGHSDYGRAFAGRPRVLP
jgi:methyltransferase